MVIIAKLIKGKNPLKPDEASFSKGSNCEKTNKLPQITNHKTVE
jgi:hypothetical protein